MKKAGKENVKRILAKRRSCSFPQTMERLKRRQKNISQKSTERKTTLKLQISGTQASRLFIVLFQSAGATPADARFIKTGSKTKFLSLFSRQAAPNPNLPHLLIDWNHLDSSAEVTCVLIRITATSKYAGNLARPDFRSPKAKP